jgi:serine protein kinase
VSDAERVLRDLTQRTAEDFERNRRILAFREYLDLVLEHPERQARSVAQYVRDCFDHFGVNEKETPWGSTRAWRLFDAEFDEGRDRLVGQEAAQGAVYRALGRFVQDGRIQRLILLHGPNGSAKSSLINCLMRALEAYSQTDEGALYQFNWIFPAEKIARSAIGFGGVKGGAVDTTESYAYLDDLDIDAKLGSELRESPLLLLPRDERVAMIQGALGDREFVLADVLERGELSHKSKQIFDALLTAYRGDLHAVLRHVQVERFFISRRYRCGAVTVEPQLRVDAGARQITADRSLQSLPASLQNQTLFEPFGDLVDGNRGVVEYNDLLKRPHDFNKYLLATSEKGTVALDNCILYLDALLVGSANETYIDAFKQTPDYPSFQARLEFVRMPYLRDYRTEERIYHEQITAAEIGKPIAPYASLVAALWAVLTRLVRPHSERYDEELQEIIDSLTPLQKSDLYAEGAVPPGLSPELGRRLRQSVPQMMEEGSEGVAYEGRFGASPRLMKTTIRNAAQSADYPHLSPLAILEELRKLARQKDVYPFLNLEPEGGYRAYVEFVDTVHARYLDLVDADVRSAMGLVTEEEYERFFERYVEHVTHWVKKETIYNAATGTSTPPDEAFMTEVELKMGATGGPESYRGNLMGNIAAWSLDHPGEPLHYPTIFSAQIDSLRQSFYDDRLDQVKRVQQDILTVRSGEEASLSPEELAQVHTTISNLCEQFGHTEESAHEVVIHLLQERYEGTL